MPRFLGWSFRKAEQDELVPQSAALAFLTLFSVVPLLAAFSLFGARFFSSQPELVADLARFLPYQENKIAAVLQQFVDSSRSLTGFGFGVFLITVLFGFNSVELVINRIWDVPKRRSWYSRLSSFLVLLLAGPILIAAAYSALFYLEREPTWQGLAQLGLVQAAPFVVTVIGLTLLNWQVPNTQVRFESALLGGVVSGLLLETLRLGFGLYVQNATQVSVVYGSFGIAMFFLISVQAAWAIVLLGTEVAYCVQNFEMLSQPRQRTSVEGSRLGLVAMVLVVDRFRSGSPRVAHEWLAARLGLPSIELRRVLEPLAQRGFLLEDSDDDGGWLLAGDPYEIRVAEVLGAYESPLGEAYESLPEETASSVRLLLDKLTQQKNAQLGELVVVDLLPCGRAGGESRGVATG